MADTIKTNLKRLKKEIKELQSQIKQLRDYDDKDLQEASDQRRVRLEGEIDKKLEILDDIYISLLSFVKWKMGKERNMQNLQDEDKDYVFKLPDSGRRKNIGDYYVNLPAYGKISLEELATVDLRDETKDRRAAGAKEIDQSMKVDGAWNPDKRVVKNLKRVVKMQNEAITEPEEEEPEQ